MKVRKEPESIIDACLKFEGVDRKKKKERTSSKVNLSLIAKQEECRSRKLCAVGEFGERSFQWPVFEHVSLIMMYRS